MGLFDFGKKKVTYKLVKSGRAVYVGTTSSPKLRNAQHSGSGKRYDYMQVTSPRVSKTEAERREARNLSSYKKATGKKPKYNKTSNGKFNKWY